MKLVGNPETRKRRPLRPEHGNRAPLFIYLITNISHRLRLKTAKTEIALVSFVALIYLDEGIEEGVRLVKVKMANSEAAWHSPPLSLHGSRHLSLTFIFQVCKRFSIAKPTWAACPLQEST